MSLTDNPDDPALLEGQKNETGQHAVYLVLSEEERAKGFVRPLRRAYMHVGEHPTFPLRDLTEAQQAHTEGSDWVKFEVYPEGYRGSAAGKYWTQAQLDFRCGEVTTMGLALCETYARNPKFYGATFCCACNKHLPVREFVWVEDGQVVGS